MNTNIIEYTNINTHTITITTTTTINITNKNKPIQNNYTIYIFFFDIIMNKYIKKK